MKIDTTTAIRTITVTTHSTLVSVDELAALATVAARSKAGVAADAPAVARRNDDGSVAVTITVETDALPDQHAADDAAAKPAVQAAPATPAIASI